MPIKVAHVVRQYSPSIGGMEAVVQSIAKSHLRRGHLPKIITLDRLFTNSGVRFKGEEVLSGISVARLPFSGSSRYPLCPGVLRHVVDADIIHVHGIDFFFDYLAVTRAIHRLPMVVSTHGGFFHTKFLSLFKKVFFQTVTRVSCHAYSKVIATSHNDGEVFRCIVSPRKLLVIENGVDVEKFRNQASVALMPTMICFGRWSRNKRLPDVIRFFRGLLAKEAGWTLIIAGREYDYGKQELMALLQKYDLAQSVQLAPNPSEEDMARLIARSSYFISLSGHEGFGIAPVEAMSAGLTPVLSDLPPFRDLIERSGLGALVDVDNMGRGIESLLSIHHEGEGRYQGSRAAAQLFVQRYNLECMAGKYLDVYTDLLR